MSARTQLQKALRKCNLKWLSRCAIAILNELYGKFNFLFAFIEALESWMLSKALLEAGGVIGTFICDFYEDMYVGGIKQAALHNV